MVKYYINDFRAVMDLLTRLLRLRMFFITFTFLTTLVLFCIFFGIACRVILNEYKVNTEKNVDKYITISNKITKDTVKTLSYLNSNVKGPCDKSLIYKMRMVQYHSDYAKDIGYTENGSLVCTTGLGQLNKPFKEIPPQFVTTRGISMWINVPIKLFNFEQLGTVAKQGHFNVVINIDDFKNIDSTNYSNAIFVNKGSDEIDYLAGNKNLKIPADSKNNTWATLSGIYSFKCSGSSIVCAMSHISLGSAISMESETLTGVALLSFMSAFFIAQFINNFLKKQAQLKNRLLRNLDEDHILTYYQPIISFSDGRTIGCEVLSRWQDTSGDIVAPDNFLGIVKDAGKTELFTAIMIDKTFRELGPYIDINRPFKIGFNFFPGDFNYRFITNTLGKYKKMYPNLSINIELTEDELVEAPKIAEHIDTLRKEGFMVSIDDFGTGYCSLSYLQEIQADYIKIDKSFIRDLEIGTVKSQLIPHIVSIARTVGADIIVEGVENEEQLRYMKEMGIEYAQGYHFSPPIPLKDFIKFI